MFWPLIRALKSLSGLQHVTIFITVLLFPASLDVAQGWINAGFCPSCVIWSKAALYVVFYAVAVVAIGCATRRDRAGISGSLNRVRLEVTREIHQLREEQQQKIIGVQDQADALADWARNIRQALDDELGINLPRYAPPLRVSASAGIPTCCADLAAPNPRGWRRLGLWGRRQFRNIRRWGRIIFMDWEGRGRSGSD